MIASSTMDCPASVNDEIQESMGQFLKSRMQAVSHGIQCEFAEGMLFIRGNVGSYYTKQLTQEFARQIPGVDQVVNHLNVEKQAG